MRGLALALAGAALAVSASAARSDAPPRGRVAFVRYTVRSGHPQIYVVPAAGGAARRLPLPVTAAQGPAWAPDGRRLAFVAGVNPAGQSDIAGPTTLYVAKPDGSALRRLTPGKDHDGSVTWAPDGKRLVFVRQAAVGNRSSLRLVSAAGGPSRRLTYGNTDLEPSWAPDGRTIVFLRIDGKTGQAGIWLVRPDGSKLHRILAALGNVTEPVWSPDGKLLLVEDGRALYTVRPDGSGRRTVAKLTPDAQGAFEDPLATWSPNGRWIAFCQLRAGALGASDIWLVAADGSGLHRLLRAPELDTDPSFER